MSAALERSRVAAVDVSTPVFWGVGVFLFLLVAIPLGWIAVRSVLAAQGTFTLAYYAQLVSNPTWSNRSRSRC